MELFAQGMRGRLEAEAPLASRMRPRTLEEFVGQDHLVGPGRVLRRAIEADELTSVLLWGPPGTGKTSLAHIIANVTHSHFVQVNAVTSGVAELKRIIEEAKERRLLYGTRTILFIDEIHRFNKAQQDVLLPYVEDGTIILIGATTENPFYEVNATLVSRSRVFRLEPLRPEHVRTIVERALRDPERGLGKYRIHLDEQAMAHICQISNGDARVALNILELACMTTPPDKEGVRHVSLPQVEEASQRRAVLYDREGDQHYDSISAFIKSMRGSDPDAAVYWLARMLYAGEDPRYIARRMIVHAAEDVGLADPMALVVATAAAHAVEYVGLPEARIPLAEAAIYIATAPKSNSVVQAISRAMEDVEKKQAEPVPIHLRDSSHPQVRERMGHGKGYKYVHDFPGRFVLQQYLPDNLQGTVYYEPSDSGFEVEIRKRLEQWWQGVKRYSRESD